MSLLNSLTACPPLANKAATTNSVVSGSGVGVGDTKSSGCTTPVPPSSPLSQRRMPQQVVHHFPAGPSPLSHVSSSPPSVAAMAVSSHESRRRDSADAFLRQPTSVMMNSAVHLESPIVVIEDSNSDEENDNGDNNNNNNNLDDDDDRTPRNSRSNSAEVMPAALLISNTLDTDAAAATAGIGGAQEQSAHARRDSSDKADADAVTKALSLELDRFLNTCGVSDATRRRFHEQELTLDLLVEYSSLKDLEPLLPVLGQRYRVWDCILHERKQRVEASV
eukprot:m.56471 g.56471  ORF g.56471 m.56471 type:complete len:278 (+) comp13391_c3_seq1:603-1436(+)